MPATRVIFGVALPTSILRIMLLPMSAIHRVSTPFSLLMNSDFGWSRATVSGSAEIKVSSVLPQAAWLVGAFWPVPAYLVMVPAVSTFRMRQFWLSAMYTLPTESTATPWGSFSWAEVAGPPSPAYPPMAGPSTGVGEPATRVTLPSAPILRTRWLRASVM